MAGRFTIGAFGIVFDGDRRVLLCHRRDIDLWNLPGGGVEAGEAPWETVVREVRDETGLEITVQRLQGIYTKPQTDDVVFSFVCAIIGGAVMLNDEADRIAWFAAEEIPLNTSPKQRERVHDALERPHHLALRTQYGPSSIELFSRDRATHQSSTQGHEE